jgi:DNA (cytosine-5)-methyltransferase 1
MAVRQVLGGELAWVSDIDPGACAVLAHHHPDVPNLGDVSHVDWSQVEPVDVLTGGFPCTDVSAAGKQDGLYEGTRSGLWGQMGRAIGALRPRLVVIENVRGLLTARGAPPTADLVAAWEDRDQCDQGLAYLARAQARAARSGNKELLHRVQAARLRYVGRRRRAASAAQRADALIVRAIGTVLGDLARLGYDARWCGLRAADVGAPHGRFRVFVIAVPSVARGVAPNPAGNGRDEGRAEPARLVRGLDVAVGGANPASDADGAGREGREPARRRDLPARGTAAHPDSLGRERAGTARDGSTGPADHGEPAADTENDRREQLHDGALGDAARQGWVQHLAGSSGLLPAVPGVFDERPAVGLDWGDYGPAVDRWAAILGRPAPWPTITSAKGNPVLNPAFVQWLMGLDAGHVTGVPGLSRNQMLTILGNGVVWQQGAAAIAYLLAHLSAAAAA